MGVLACSRYNCSNIMCDRYSHVYGYLCAECFEELVSLGKGVNVEKFLRSQKREIKENGSFDKWDREFPLHDDTV